MKIKVKSVLRGAGIMADPGDVIVIDDSIANRLIKADAAVAIDEIKEIPAIIEAPIVIEEIKTVKKRR